MSDGTRDGRGPSATPPHAATVAQPKRAFGGVAARPPHAATVAQPKRAFGGVAARPPHAATAVERAPGMAMERPVVLAGGGTAAGVAQRSTLGEDNSHLSALDLTSYVKPSSGRSGNTVLLGSSFVYKLFKNVKEYTREVEESIELGETGVPILFHKALGYRQVNEPGGISTKAYVLMMYRAQGTTHMLAKSGGIAKFCNEIKKFKGNLVQLANLRRWFDSASNAGVKDAQFIYDSDTNTPNFMDVHLGGVKGGGDCREVVNFIDSL
ncbi:hypothetical protein WMF11_32080 [Sorangium sp. So ce295]|uniref:hypothetical protein n=1 Tax=Sorangium sp. So ce295 TaxID=3133295 RepID=UPI003F632A2A